MSVLQAQVIVPHDNGLPVDAIVNTFHFGTSGPLVDDAAATSITTALTSMYDTLQTSGNRLASYYPDVMKPDATRIKIIRLNDAPPRTPLKETTVFLNSSGGGALPSEVALVGSYQGAKISGVSQARRRGRFYFGPLNESSRVQVGGVGARPAQLLIDTMNLAMQTLWTASEAAVDWSWVVYSPTIGLVGGTTPVTNGWVDNAFDTQRRRGLKASARTTRIFV